LGGESPRYAERIFPDGQESQARGCATIAEPHPEQRKRRNKLDYFAVFEVHCGEARKALNPMRNPNVPATRPLALAQAPPRPASPEEALNAFLASAQSPLTRIARLRDLAAFGYWLYLRSGQPRPEDLRQAAARGAGALLLLSPDRGGVQAAAEAFLAEGLAGKSPATRNRARSTLRSFAKAALRWGLVDRDLVLPGERTMAYRDTRGPGQDAVAQLWAQARAGEDPRSRRDAALIALLYGMGLRAGEVLTLDFEHYDHQRGLLAVREKKGGGERRLLTLPPEAREALDRWIEIRGLEPGPLFLGLQTAGRGQIPTLPPPGKRKTMSRYALDRIVRRWSVYTGSRVRAHGLRHSAITACLDQGFGVREVQRFARHANIQTTTMYDDNREDIGGKVAAAHLAELEADRKKIEAREGRKK